MKRKTSYVSLAVALLVPVSLILALLAGCAKPESASVNAPKAQAAKSVEDEDFMGLTKAAGIYEVLDLTPQQEEQIHEIILQHKTEGTEGLRERSKCKDWQELKKRRQARRQALHDKILAILNPTQRAKAIAMKEQLDRGEIPRELIDLRVKRLAEKLGLSDEQQRKIRILFAETGKKIWALKQECEKPKSAHKDIRKILTESEKQLLSYLTPEQQETYAALQDARKERMKDRFKRMRRHGAKQRLEHLSQALNLTADQEKQIKKILADVRPDMKKLVKDDMTPEERQKAMIQHQRETDRAILAILTAEQQAKYQELIKDRQNKRKRPGDGPMPK